MEGYLGKMSSNRVSCHWTICAMPLDHMPFYIGQYTSSSLSHRQFCLYYFQRCDWSRQNQNNLNLPQGTGNTVFLADFSWRPHCYAKERSSSTKLTINFTNVDLFLHLLCFELLWPFVSGIHTQQLARLLKLLDASTTAPDAD